MISRLDKLQTSRRARRRKLVRMRDAQGWNCILCGEGLTDPSWEHLIPRVHGGSNSLCNLALSCRHCNCKRGSAPLTEAQEKRARAAHAAHRIECRSESVHHRCLHAIAGARCEFCDAPLSRHDAKAGLCSDLVACFGRCEAQYGQSRPAKEPQSDSAVRVSFDDVRAMIARGTGDDR